MRRIFSSPINGSTAISQRPPEKHFSMRVVSSLAKGARSAGMARSTQCNWVYTTQSSYSWLCTALWVLRLTHHQSRWKHSAYQVWCKTDIQCTWTIFAKDLQVSLNQIHLSIQTTTTTESLKHADRVLFNSTQALTWRNNYKSEWCVGFQGRWKSKCFQSIWNLWNLHQDKHILASVAHWWRTWSIVPKIPVSPVGFPCFINFARAYGKVKTVATYNTIVSQYCSHLKPRRTEILSSEAAEFSCIIYWPTAPAASYDTRRVQQTLTSGPIQRTQQSVHRNSQPRDRN